MTEPDPDRTTPMLQEFLYSGSSMHSTFSPGQVLYVRPVARGIRPGDVVVYHRGSTYVVHRVVSVGPQGICTRGDDNAREDDSLVFPAEIIGVVSEAVAGEEMVRVLGGRRGLRTARLRWWFIDWLDHLRPWLGAPYRWLKARRWVERVWNPKVTVVQLRSQNGILAKYLVRGKVVATWEPGRGRFICHKPFDLVLFPPPVTSLDPVGSERPTPSCKPGSTS